MATINGQQYNQLSMNPGDFIWNQPGQLSPYAQGQLNNISVDKSALNQNRAEALRQGPSAWRGLEQKTIQSNQKNQVNQAASASAGQEAQARSALAMRGGLSGGARERIAREGGNNFLSMSQDAANQANQAGYQADSTDESNRIKQLGAQPGMEAAAAQPELAKAQMNIGANQYDINNNINSYDKLNYANLEKYKANMGAWAAGQQAQATQNSGKK